MMVKLGSFQKKKKLNFKDWVMKYGREEMIDEKKLKENFEKTNKKF